MSATLLKKRIHEVTSTVAATGLMPEIERLNRELLGKGLQYLNPRFYIGDEWFSPQGSCLISIPFYLCSQKLRKLEKQMMGSVEGGTKDWAMRLLRHETGHCLDHAYGLSHTRGWQRIFGSPKQPYQVEHYAFDPTSDAYVTNLEGHYAQSHPEEDFAETFAVWLDPHSQWKTTYRGTPALAKLRYIENVVKTLKTKPPLPLNNRPLSDARYLKRSLARYYAERKPLHTNATSVATLH